MFRGEKINKTENRSVLHVALRMQRDQSVEEVPDAVENVHKVLDRISAFSDKVRSGLHKGHTGKNLRNFIIIGIGGSHLGSEYIFEALRQDASAKAASEGFTLRFLANADPVDLHRAVHGLSMEETLFVIVSKTFTTAETMLNARSAKTHLLAHFGQDLTPEVQRQITGAHIAAVSTNLKGTADFGILDENVFGFWDWVGGRYSCASAVGVLPLSLFYSYPVMRQFLDGMNNMDNHFRNEKDTRKNLPLLLALVGWYNTFICEYNMRAIIPYSQGLMRFAAHMQQVDTESNGKSTSLDGALLDYECGPMVVGEPGTNAQHSFFQLLHQGRVIPIEFIGFAKSQTPIHQASEIVSNHDELMSNFFAQPDALALGKDLEQLEKEGVPEHLRAHKLFSGDRPSLSLLF